MRNPIGEASQLARKAHLARMAQVKPVAELLESERQLIMAGRKPAAIRAYATRTGEPLRVSSAVVDAWAYDNQFVPNVG